MQKKASKKRAKSPDEMGQKEVLISVNVQKKLLKLSDEELGKFFRQLDAILAWQNWDKNAKVNALLWEVLAFNVRLRENRL